MAGEWRECRLGDIVELKRGYDLPKQERIDGRVPIISSSGPSGYHNEAMVKAPGVVTGRYGTLGQVFYLVEDFWPLNTTLYVRDFKGNDPKFVGYFLRTIDFLSCSDKAAVPGVNRNHLHQLAVVVPPPPEQRAIAHILGTLDDKIELNRRMNETLEAMARALFKSWFVDFDPVRAKAEGRQPPGMDPATAALFPRAFQDSALGPIPNGWQHVPVRQVCEGLFDGPHATPPEAESGAVFLGIKNFSPTSLDLTSVRYISEDDWPRWTKRVEPRHEDIVFTYEATLGFFALIPPNLRCCLGRRTALVRPRSDARDSHYLFHWFIAPPFQEFLRAHRQPGSTVDRIWLKDFPEYPVLQPPKQLVRLFEEKARLLWSRIHSNQAETATLAALRDALLPRLLSGELSVGKAMKLVEARA